MKTGDITKIRFGGFEFTTKVLHYCEAEDDSFSSGIRVELCASILEAHITIFDIAAAMLRSKIHNPEGPCWCWHCRTGAGSAELHKPETGKGIDGDWCLTYTTGSGHWYCLYSRGGWPTAFDFIGSMSSFLSGSEYATVEQ